MPFQQSIPNQSPYFCHPRPFCCLYSVICIMHNILQRYYPEHSIVAFSANHPQSIAIFLSPATFLYLTLFPIWVGEMQFTHRSCGGTPQARSAPRTHGRAVCRMNSGKPSGKVPRSRPEMSEAFRRLRTILRQAVKSLKGAAAPAFT